MKATIFEVKSAKEEAEVKINGILSKFIDDYELTDIKLVTQSFLRYDDKRRPISISIKTHIEVRI